MDVPIPTRNFSATRLKDMPFEILRLEELPAIANQPHPHRHSFYEIFWVVEGNGTHNIDFEAWTVYNNTLYFISPGQVHFWEVTQPLKGYAILYTQDFIVTNLLDQITLQSFDFYHHTSRQPLVHIDDNNAQTFNALCEALILEYENENYGRYALLQCHLLSLLIHAQRHVDEMGQLTANSAGEQLVANYLQKIDVSFQDIRNIHDYASLLGVSSGHLSDMVREYLGTTPIHLLNKRIALEAKRQLIHSEQTIAEVGLALNFDTPSYFSRFFKREVGSAPSDFRRQFREKYQHPRP